jgi:type I restriction enzyme S subunit
MVIENRMMGMEGIRMKENEIVLPEGWRMVRADELGNLLRGINYKKEEARDIAAKGYIPVLRANNIDGRINYENLVYVPISNVDKEQRLRKGDILFAMSSGSKHLVGKSARVLEDFEGSFGAFCGLFRTNDIASNLYITYFFQGPVFKRAISEIATGTNINNLKRGHILDTEIPLPPIAEQHRIVSKIEELFSELEIGKEQILLAQQQLKTYRQAVLKWAFEGRLTNADVVDGVLPEGWEWKSLDLLASRITDGEHFRPVTQESGVPFLSAKDVRDNGVSFENPLYISEETAVKALARCNPEKGDILIVSRGATVGRMCIVNTERPFCLLGSVILIKAKKEVSSKYLAYSLKAPSINQTLIAVSGATAQQAIYLRDIKSVMLAVCPIQEQHRIVQEIESRLSVCDAMEATLQTSLAQAEVLRQSILKRAFEGRLG